MIKGDFKRCREFKEAVVKLDSKILNRQEINTKRKVLNFLNHYKKAYQNHVGN